MKPDSDETSGFKVDSFIPKCNQAGCICNWKSQLLSEWYHATKLVAFGIGGVNFCLSGFMQPSWLHLGLKESTLTQLAVSQ